MVLLSALSSEKMFAEDKGMQKDSKKLLVVITDGKSNDHKEKLDEVLQLAQAMNVTMYAIGVRTVSCIYHAWHT